ncbi:tRNA (adenosine(37)-N6)-dimethylallyltransferase MiaA [bacterium]|nr:tRNA (adenosine(37)-N6)-dimethylallyltransferase MiaA [bacterium]
MKKNSNKNKAIVIVGPTSSGKTSLGIKLAEKFSGEIIGADSRQVYKGMDIGTGKDLKDYTFLNNKKEKIKIPYHLIDVVLPSEEFNLVKYLKLANKALDDITERGKLPIIVGGSGLYVQALVDNYTVSDSKPNKKRREELEKMSKEELYSIIEKDNKYFAKRINNSDKNNKRRLVRYIEILEGDKKLNKRIEHPKFDFLVIGSKVAQEKLKDNIYKRLISRLEEGMVDEVKGLYKNGLSWERLDSFGLEYRYVSAYLRKKITYQEMVDKLFIEIRKFSKRQNTWFRRWEKQGREIKWVNKVKDAEKLINNFIS